MGDTVLIETTADEVVSIVTQGPQGPSGAEAATLTTTGDLLYRAALANDRLPIGSEGQVLKVSGGIPAWGNESGAVTSVNGETGAVTLDAADVGAATSAQGALADTAVQPGDLATVATSGDYDDLTNKPASFTPSAHAASHQAGGSDELFDQSLNTSDSVTFENVTVTSSLSAVFNQTLEIEDNNSNVVQLNAGADFLTSNRSFQFPNASGTISLEGHAHSSTDISDSTTAGRAILTGADAAAQRTSLGLGTLATINNPLTTAGDLLTATSGGTPARLGIGSSGQQLRVSSGGSLEYFTPSAGGATNLWLPASCFIPKTTAGCGVDSRETSTNDQNFDELLFDAGSDEFADALVVMPSNYNNGTITARFYWTAASGSGGVAWAIQGRAFANDDALDTAAGTAQLVTDTLIAADDMHVTSATSAVTIGGTPAANTPIQFSIYRDVSDAADDLAVDARLLGVEIIFN